ncbi:NAD(P) transhydrogenase subunit alpha [Thalassoglobus neptunius]|uniref:proton-translocating NAD(P)(+) transhydrogenase n=2 Tax=Thalassoglobus neptunius TaxID=1938619 RepID=A0A5C5WPC7_9PLAN|nr:NAD(P) transhydrogenase subunit alpha [Thalassoglobus neptunius]TWT51971.1 NAD(P) transhydrogenase subunit alpha [Thalassoglobus neptunius]
MPFHPLLLVAPVGSEEAIQQSIEQISEMSEAISTVAGYSAGLALVQGLTVFALAVFVGFEIITKIPPTLHTPLMSGSNAISGITLVGAIFATGAKQHDFATFLGFLAVIMATVNVIGGFMVTHRMLQKFKR